LGLSGSSDITFEAQAVGLINTLGYYASMDEALMGGSMTQATMSMIHGQNGTLGTGSPSPISESDDLIVLLVVAGNLYVPVLQNYSTPAISGVVSQSNNVTSAQSDVMYAFQVGVVYEYESAEFAPEDCWILRKSPTAPESTQFQLFPAVESMGAGPLTIGQTMSAVLSPPLGSMSDFEEFVWPLTLNGPFPGPSEWTYELSLGYGFGVQYYISPVNQPPYVNLFVDQGSGCNWTLATHGNPSTPLVLSSSPISVTSIIQESGNAVLIPMRTTSDGNYVPIAVFASGYSSTSSQWILQPSAYAPILSRCQSNPAAVGVLATVPSVVPPNPDDPGPPSDEPVLK